MYRWSYLLAGSGVVMVPWQREGGIGLGTESNNAAMVPVPARKVPGPTRTFGPLGGHGRRAVVWYTAKSAPVAEWQTRMP
jgi:hypothetical protein